MCDEVLCLDLLNELRISVFAYVVRTRFLTLTKVTAENVDLRVRISLTVLGPKMANTWE